MTTTTMHFGPEWMRAKPAPSRPNPSPPLTTPVSAGASTYSALVAPVSQPPAEKRDLAHPFRYSKDDMIRIYREGGGKGGLGLEVERWEGIVRELGSDPISIKEMSDAEKKIFSGPLNSEMRRRPSTDYLTLSTSGLGERPKLNHVNTGPGSPMRERLGGFMGRRRDSTDQPPLTLPRKLSQSSLQPPLASPRDGLPSPRSRIGGTTGFDGVLSDAWSSRRRASEGLVKGGTRPGDVGDSGDGTKAAGIKEEEEEHHLEHCRQSNARGAEDHQKTSPSVDPAENNIQRSQSTIDNFSDGMDKLSLNGQAPLPSSTSLASNGDTSGPPPGIVDLAAVEWSYLDPQGQVQGPFPAATMQKWFEDGYFTVNLLMKRTRIDTEWTSVGELVHRVGNNRIFLTPLVAPPPPGLPRRDPLLDASIPDGSFSAPFQPVPTRSLRTSTLDYLHTGSMVPDSPSSTFSSGRFSNNSPDPAAFAGRFGGHLYSESPVGSRLGFSAIQGNGMDAQRRSTFDDATDTLLSRPGFQGYLPGRGSVDGLNFHAVDPNNHSSLSGQFISNTATPSQMHQNDRPADKGTGQAQGSPVAASQMSFGPSEFNGLGVSLAREGPRLINRDLFERAESQTAIPNQFANGSNIHFSQNSQTFPPNQPLSYAAPQEHRPLHSAQQISDRHALANTSFQQSFISASASASSPWPHDVGTARRPGPFEPDFPTARNTVVLQNTAPLPQPVVTPSRTNSQLTSSNQSPWSAASQTAAGEGWGPDNHSLTAANLGQHNKQQELQDTTKEQQVKQAPEEVHEPDVQLATSPDVATAPEPIPDVTASSTQKGRRKANASAATPTTAPAQSVKPAASIPTTVKPPSPAVASAENKPAWILEDDKKGKPSGATMSLREIQELETKKQEARKAAERERLTRLAAATPSTSGSEDVQTLSWGLPTSQAGARPTKELSLPIPQIATPTIASTPVTPVWTTPVKTPVAKKTMKEIQEEEEKRKKLAKDKETVASAARRTHIDTPAKPTVVVQTGGAWTTVGSSGKSNIATATPIRAAVTTSPSSKPVTVVASTSNPVTPLVTTRAPALATATRSPIVTAAMKLASPAPKLDEAPAPSHDFLKWLTDSLKGLNNSVNLEEITAMLLTFPLDPDSSTMEIISDLIYANSTTLDGRRFASEYVSRRKTDAKGSASSGKPLSIADVVKTQPKPAQNEWGGFKVVNKKKKGSRA